MKTLENNNLKFEQGEFDYTFSLPRKYNQGELLAAAKKHLERIRGTKVSTEQVYLHTQTMLGKMLCLVIEAEREEDLNEFYCLNFKITDAIITLNLVYNQELTMAFNDCID